MEMSIKNAPQEQYRKRSGILAVNLGLAANILLAGLKTSIGILGHSPALLADGINSVSDVAYYMVVSVFMRLAYKPADDEHPYGHTQLESIAALVIGSFIITTAIAIFWESVNDIFDFWLGTGELSGAGIVALWVAIFTVLLKSFLFYISQHIGRSTQNAAVLALAYDHRNDIITASTATFGIALGRAGYYWVDPLAGALVALVILRTGIKILQDSSYELMDTVPGKELNFHIQNLSSSLPGVKKVEEIKVHRFGPYLVINITIGIDGGLSVMEGDRISTRVENALLSDIPQTRRVHVHYHPA